MISEPEWQSIAAMVEKIIRSQVGLKSNYFTSGKVIKVDKTNKCIFLKEFGDQPIPLVFFDWQVKYYDETPNGTTSVAAGNAQPFKTRTKTVKAEVVMPTVGQTVLVVREMGAQRLPRCIGVIQGKKWLVSDLD
jgi:hypothetical protein